MKRRELAFLFLIPLMLALTGTAVEAQAPDTAPRSLSVRISLQLKQVDIEDVLRTLSEKSGYNIVAEEGVKGRVTLYLEEISISEALDIMCNLHKLAYVKQGKTIMVLTEAAYQAAYGERFRDPVKTEVFTIKNVPVDVIATQLTPLRSKDGYSIVDTRTNTLIIAELPSVLEKIGETIKILDVPAVTRSFVLDYATPAEINTVITPFLSRSAIISQQASKNTIVITDAAANIEKVASVIADFDRQPATETRLFELKYVRADAAVNQITGLLTEGVGNVQADQRTNSLLVTDLSRSMAGIEQAIAAIDAKPREVLVEAKIIQVSLDESNKMGVNWEAVIEDIDHNDFNIKSKFKVLGSTDDGVTVTGGVLAEDNYTALVEALSTHGKADLLSAPRLLVLNETEARILVGSTVPYKTVDTREESGSLRTFEKVTIIDVGVKLFVTPTINSDSVITLKIKPEVSSVTGFSDNVPIVEKSETETIVMVNDGITVLIGGLVRDEKRETIKGIPILSRIPILGIPFRSKTTQKVKTELAILITPHIVTGEQPIERPGAKR